MIIPIKCFTCGKVLANKWTEYERLVSEQKDADKVDHGPNFDKHVRGKILDQLGLDKMCCRRIMLGHVSFE